MKILTINEHVYETDKIEAGGWDEEHEKFSYDRIVFYDHKSDDWKNVPLGAVVSITA